MPQPYIIGIDIGTTGTKSVLFSQNGAALSKALIEYPLHSPTPNAAVQDPPQIFAAVLNTVRQVMAESQVDPKAVIGLALSSAMHSLIAVAADGSLLTPSITWADNRAAGWAEQLKLAGGLEIYRRTGTPIHPMSPLVKLIWLRQEQPQIFQAAAHFISIKEYVTYQMFGQYWVDYSIASATGLFNLARLTWDSGALEVAGIRAEQLSTPVPTTQILSGMKANLASQMGLLPNTPVVIGASDGTLSNLGLGAVSPGQVAVTIGTSGAIRAVVNQPVSDPQSRLFCYALTDQHWVVGGAVNNGGIALRWIRDQVAQPDPADLDEIPSYEPLMQLAAAVPAGADGLLFHPYLLGERSPLWDANARGSFFGLTLNHGRAHLVRAVLEGVLFNMQIVLQALQDFAGATQQIQATGGFARSAFWRQMMADVFNQPITIPAQYESACLGAAILGLYALEQLDSLTVDPAMLGATYQHQPQPQPVAIYQKILPVYGKLLEKFRGEYAAIAQLQAELEALKPL
ncbi:MAG: gluconate kinase [Pegethrix bostrychoides GSE-TBD4-15B]|jgi:gluconokinase|uniref:Gluconate kinase n=1 Tax=Pegethrix bostrychoides GSE-TBD4-15B TaxID=2839662 RepID=A0A951PGK2_9CYAN|nr:gluconate kinase [Pegethrix bostrychoides GSE-TBD4-15B]